MPIKIPQFVYPLVVLLGASFMYSKYKESELSADQTRDYQLVQQFLLNDRGFKAKPILWIHNVYEINARNWLNFYSRNTKELNQPYLYLTIKSIIDRCGDDFNVCLIDDTSFSKLLPTWSVDMNQVADPLRGKLRQLGLASVLHMYGGFLVPPSFLCLKPLKPVYDQQLATYNAFVGELVSRTTTSETSTYFPDTKFMGCSKGAAVMNEYRNYLMTLLSHDFVAESDLCGDYSRWFYAKIKDGVVGVIPAQLLGAQDERGEVINVDRLLNRTFVPLSSQALGLYVPSDEILRRTNYQWFARLTTDQVLESETVLGKYLLLAQ